MIFSDLKGTNVWMSQFPFLEVFMVKISFFFLIIQNLCCNVFWIMVIYSFNKHEWVSPTI